MKKSPVENQQIPFNYLSDTFISIPMTVNESVAGNFVLDTGIGVNLLSKSLCEKLGCVPTHDHIGKRMSGQELKIPMAKVRSLAIGNVLRPDVAVGIYDIDSLMPNQNVIGLVGLDFFETVPFTLDYKNKVLILESENSLKNIASHGKVASVILDRKKDALSIMIKMLLPAKQIVKVEVDTGSQALILDERYMTSLNINKSDPKVKRKDGKDETGHNYSRFFTQLKGDVNVSGLPEVKESKPHVMFQKIIYDGLLGHNFLSQYLVTYDLPNARIIFRKPE